MWADDGPAWLHGGTTLVVRRIRAEMETWDAVDRTAREFTVGRRLDTGAPLTGTDEHDEPDFEAVNDLGFPVIPEFAHVRRAHVADPRLADPAAARTTTTTRRTPAGKPDTGLLFASYQADIARQYPADPATPRRDGPAEPVDDPDRVGGVRHPARLRPGRLDRGDPAVLTLRCTRRSDAADRARRRRGGGLCVPTASTPVPASTADEPGTPTSPGRQRASEACRDS